ncbi:MAG: DUF177 domain-containing protein [Aphanocapsa sp. GSE-SYN-MK-11-07L]|jgi:uncharacterized protein|nr:DUF177 domain-containing protein [Aphanocapsa sp. GSE-SYN-MK-11-07L]
MERIYIPQVATAPQQTQVVAVKEFLPGLETLTPLQGQLSVAHRGNFLEVTAQVESIITLTCDRCLQQYNHRLTCQVSELIWLQAPDLAEPEKPGLEVEVALEDLVETLPPQAHFDPTDWLYQQVCLALPDRRLCDLECAGIPVDDQDNRNAELQPVDRRWANLEALKKQLSS